jgi:hypothetical protein
LSPGYSARSASVTSTRPPASTARPLAMITLLSLLYALFRCVVFY